MGLVLWRHRFGAIFLGTRISCFILCVLVVFIGRLITVYICHLAARKSGGIRKHNSAQDDSIDSREHTGEGWDVTGLCLS